MSIESSKCRVVYAIADDGVSDSGHQLYTIHDEPVPLADNWVLHDASQPSEHPRGDLDKAVHAIDDLVALNGEDHDEAAWKLVRVRVLASQPKVATDAHVVGDHKAWLYRSPPEVEFGRAPSITQDAELVKLMLEAGGHEITPLVPACNAAPSQAVGAVVPEGLLDRVRSAELRIADGHCIRRVPADPTDPDLVLAEVRLFLEGKPSPFWVSAAPEVDRA